MVDTKIIQIPLVWSFDINSNLSKWRQFGYFKIKFNMKTELNFNSKLRNEIISNKIHMYSVDEKEEKKKEKIKFVKLVMVCVKIN